MLSAPLRKRDIVNSSTEEQACFEPETAQVALIHWVKVSKYKCRFCPEYKTLRNVT